MIGDAVFGIYRPTPKTYFDGMAASVSDSPEPRRFSLRLARGPRIAIAAVSIGLIAIGAWIGIAVFRRHQTEMWENHRRDQELRFSGVAAHPLDERQDELAAMLADVEQGQILTKSDVVSRLGRPDSFQETGSKEYSDRTISTRYRYQLAAGEYSFPGPERADLGAGWRADFLFDERANHGRRGRLWSVADDSKPLSVVVISDNDAEVGSHTFRSREKGEKGRKRE